jgi:hypothetical protein
MPGTSETYTNARSISPIYKEIIIVRVHPIVTPDKVAINEIEELADPAMDFCLLQVFLLYPSRVLASLVFVPRMHSPLARLHYAAEEVPNHARPIQTRPLDLVHQLFDLSSTFWSVCAAHPFLWHPTSQKVALFGSSRM